MGIGGWGFRHNPQSLNPHFSFQSPNKIFAKKNVCHYQKAEEKTQIIFNPRRVVKKIKIRWRIVFVSINPKKNLTINFLFYK